MPARGPQPFACSALDTLRCPRIALLALLLAAAAAAAAPPSLVLREVANGLAAPLEIVNAGDGSGRLFVVEKGGRIRILSDGALRPSPFLDIAAKLSTSGERGLLGLAFHPGFGTNRRFFVFYTRAADGALTVSEFLASAGDPDAADPASERIVLVIPHPGFDNHNGGRIAFGPGGYLYIATGDGGGGADPANNAQNRASLLGKLLRINVDTSPGYAIPVSNPFAGEPGAAPEIWAYGLRNPWKFSFDRATGDLYIADVGQSLWEEIDFEPAGDPGGRNYGWRVYEALHCFDPPSGCSLAGHTPPVLEYAHGGAGGRSVTGGYVYRGSSVLALRGHYLYGDFLSNRVWAVRLDGAWTASLAFEPPNALSGISSFGEDESGELYVASFNDGRLYAIEAAPRTPALQAGFTLLGNTFDSALEVASYFGTRDAPVPGVSEHVAAVWKWNAAGLRWAFFSPQLSAAENALEAAARGFDLLWLVASGEGYWVNANIALSLPPRGGPDFVWSAARFSALPPAFNLVATAGGVTPGEFGAQVASTPGEAAFESLWAWNAAQGKWYFHSPILEAQGGRDAVREFAQRFGYLDFQDGGRTLDADSGFWVHRP